MTSASQRVFIGAGSNIDPERNLVEAVERLRRMVDVEAASGVYRTVPLGESGRAVFDQPAFLNAAVEIRTSLPPAVLKHHILHGVETSLGRVRTTDRFAARTIDLDIALYSDHRIDDEESGLTIPDPDILRHAHVAVPLADLAPSLCHPIDGRTLGEIAAALLRSGERPQITALRLPVAATILA